MKSLVTPEQVTNLPWPSVTRRIIHADQPVTKAAQYIYIEAIIDAIHEPILILDKNLTIQSANKAFFQVFKIIKRKTQGVHLGDLGKPGPQLDKLMRHLKKLSIS